MAQLSVQQRFQVNAQSVTEIVLGIVQRSKDKAPQLGLNDKIIIMGAEFLRHKKPEDLIESFIVYSEAYWPHIRARSVQFFADSADKIFGQMPTQDLAPFKTLFTHKLIEQKDIEQLFNYLNQMIRQAIRFLYDQLKFAQNVIIAKDTPNKREFEATKIKKLIGEYEVKI